MFRKTGSDWQLGTNATKFVLEGLEGQAAEVARELMAPDVNAFIKSQRQNFQLGSIPSMNTNRATPLGRYSFVNNGRNSTLRMQPSRPVAQFATEIQQFRELVTEGPPTPPYELPEFSETPNKPFDVKVPEDVQERIKRQQDIVALMVPQPCWFIDLFDYTPGYGSTLKYTIEADAWGESKIFNLAGDYSAAYLFALNSSGPVEIPQVTQPLGTFAFTGGLIPTDKFSSEPCSLGQRILLNLSEDELNEHLTLTMTPPYYRKPINYEPNQYFNPYYFYTVNYANKLAWKVSKVQLVQNTRLTSTEYIQKYIKVKHDSPYGSVSYFQPYKDDSGIHRPIYPSLIYKTFCLAGYRLPNGKFMPLPQQNFSSSSFEAMNDCLAAFYATPATFNGVYFNQAGDVVSLYEVALRYAISAGKFTNAPPPFISEDLTYKLLYSYTQEPIPKGLGVVW